MTLYHYFGGDQYFFSMSRAIDLEADTEQYKGPLRYEEHDDKKNDHRKARQCGSRLPEYGLKKAIEKYKTLKIVGE